MSFFEHKKYYLVGIKGVAMASLAQLLVDAGKTVIGSDVAEDFVTQKVLANLSVHIDTQFDPALLDGADCVVYTAAHQGTQNPQVAAAIEKNIPVFSHAEALAEFFNQQKGVAVCGVGGKSSVSAMITWILEKNGIDSSYSVGVGGIVGMEKTGHWNPQSEYFIAEADEYVTDPAAVAQGAAPIARFSFLKPFVTICMHLKYDHPDVYASEEQTMQTFESFFSQIHSEGTLILNEQDTTRNLKTSAMHTLSFGTSDQATLKYEHDAQASSAGVTVGTFTYNQQQYPVQLSVPGLYNLENAAAAALAAVLLGVKIEDSISALASFASTMRRFEFKGEVNGVKYYDDYGHHPSELQAVITAAYEWYDPAKTVISFQPHTYSRTKHLFSEFVEVLAQAKRLVLLDIFASARESFDESVSSQQLADAIKTKNPACEVQVLPNVAALAQFCQTQLHQGDTLLTIGAGDVYHVHDIIQTQQNQ